MGIMFVLFPIITNITWYYTQDAFISFATYLISLFLLPIIVSKIIGQDIYLVLNYKSLSGLRSSRKMIFLIVWISISTLFIIGFVYFNWIKLGWSLINQAPTFKHEILFYLYAFVTLLVMLLAFSQEIKLYYGILTMMLPEGFLEYILLGLYQTVHWIGFSLVFLNSTGNAFIFLGVLLAFYISLAVLREMSGYKDSQAVYLAHSAYVFLLFLLYVFL